MAAAREARLLVVIGPVEAGKSTLVAAIARDLASRGARVGIVDADVGQAEIGPPTTVALGEATADLQRVGDARPVAMRFAGVTSPAQDLAAVLAATRCMVDRARTAGFQRILVNTGGLVAGGLGRYLKQAKIDLLDPDLVIAVTPPGELAHVLARYATRARPRVVEIPALPAPRRRSTVDRARFRREALDRALAGALALRLGVKPGAVAVVSGARPGAPAVAAPELGGVVGMLVGLEDRQGELRGLGVVGDVDAAGTIEVFTPVPAAAIATVIVGRVRYAES